MSNALQILEEISLDFGCSWNDQSMMEILAEYIDRQQSNEAFEDFVRQRAAEECEECQEYEVDSLCNVCMVKDHDTCANNPSCPCCLDTMERLHQVSK